MGNKGALMQMQECRNAGMQNAGMHQKCRNAGMQKCRNAEMQECRNAEMRNAECLSGLFLHSCIPALLHCCIAASFLFALAVSVQAQTKPAPLPVTDYVVGPQDILTITSYDQADLSGKFSVEADGTFTYPMIGRVKGGGLTLRQLEGQVKKQLKDDGYFRNPQITVAVETYKSQKIFVVGE